MLNTINKENCNEMYVKLDTGFDSCCKLIVSPDEVLYLKKDHKVLVDDYLNNYLFPLFDKNFPGIIYEYNKTYLDFSSTSGGYSFQELTFFKGQDRALEINEPICLNEDGSRRETILTRKQIEDFFNKDKYDGIYILDKNNNIFYAYNKKNGLLIDNIIIPSDEQIQESELNNRIGNYQIAKQIYEASYHDKPFQYLKPINSKPIEEIKNYKLFGGLLFSFYAHMLLTVKNGKFNLKWFRIDLLEKNKFKLTTTNIPINEFTVDTVLGYYKQEMFEQIKKETTSNVKDNYTIEEVEGILKRLKQNKQKIKRKWFKNI